MALLASAAKHVQTEIAGFNGELFVIIFFSGYYLNVFKLVRFLGGRCVNCQVLIILWV